MRVPLAFVALLVAGCASREIPLSHDGAHDLAAAAECRVSAVGTGLEVVTPRRDPAAIATQAGASPTRRVAEGLVRRLGTDRDLARVRFRFDGDPTPWQLHVSQAAFSVQPRDEAKELYRVSYVVTAELKGRDGEVTWRSTCDASRLEEEPEWTWELLLSRDGATLNEFFERTADRCVSWFWQRLHLTS